MRRRLALALAALLLLGSCTAVGLSVAGDRVGSGSGTVTARADVGGPAQTGAPTPGPGATPPAADASLAPAAVSVGSPAGAPETSAGDAPPGRPSGTPAPAASAKPSKVTMLVTGSTAGLVPGRTGQVLPVVITNPAGNKARVVLTVTRVDVEVRGGAGSCPPEDLVVSPYDATADGARSYVVERGGQVVVELPVLFVDRPDRDQTDCAAATFPLTITATAGVSS